MWYIPRWLDRILPRFTIEPPHAEAEELGIDEDDGPGPGAPERTATPGAA